MANKNRPDGEIERLTAAVADRFAASAKTVRLAGSRPELSAKASLIDRLASAVAQRLAARSGANIDLLASAIAHRLAASPGAARLASSAARQFAHELIWTEPELDHLVNAAQAGLAASSG